MACSCFNRHARTAQGKASGTLSWPVHAQPARKNSPRQGLRVLPWPAHAFTGAQEHSKARPRGLTMACSCSKWHARTAQGKALGALPWPIHALTEVRGPCHMRKRARKNRPRQGPRGLAMARSCLNGTQEQAKARP